MALRSKMALHIRKRALRNRMLALLRIHSRQLRNRKLARSHPCRNRCHNTMRWRRILEYRAYDPKGQNQSFGYSEYNR